MALNCAVQYGWSATLKLSPGGRSAPSYPRSILRSSDVAALSAACDTPPGGRTPLYPPCMLRLLGMLAIVAGIVPGCQTECVATPYARLAVAALRPPPAAPPPVAIGACPRLVAFDGRQYEYAALGTWDIEANALNEIGVASGSNDPLTEEAKRVYAIDGIAPASAIAMRTSDGGDLTVLIPRGTTFTPALCPYLAGDRPLSCDEPAGEPPSTSPKAP